MTQVRVAHCSMQFSDTGSQHTQDAQRLFDRCSQRGVRWVTGTEAGPGAGNLTTALQTAAERFGYHFFTVAKTDGWVAVQKTFIGGRFEGHYDEVFKGVAHQHPSRGVLWVEFASKRLGHISVGTAHYLTHGKKPGDPFFPQNVKYIDAVNQWARAQGAGRRLAFYGGDQNMVDRTSDTFHGGPLTSLWDELHRYEDTGHGNIDVIASYDLDARVKGVRITALDDREFFLNSDHFLVEGEFEVRPLDLR